MTTLVLDSNIISYLLNGDQEIANKYRKESIKGFDFVLTPIVCYEIKRWLIANHAKNKLNAFEDLVSSWEIGPSFNNDVWATAVKIYIALRKNGTPIGDGDIFIAAYCLVHNYTLITNNESHFKHITNLKIKNWKKPIKTPNKTTPCP